MYASYQLHNACNTVHPSIHPYDKPNSKNIIRLIIRVRSNTHTHSLSLSVWFSPSHSARYQQSDTYIGRQNQKRKDHLSLLTITITITPFFFFFFFFVAVSISKRISSVVMENMKPGTGRANISTIIPGWFSEISPMWPGINIANSNSSFVSLSMDFFSSSSSSEALN